MIVIIIVILALVLVFAPMSQTGKMIGAAVLVVLAILLLVGVLPYGQPLLPLR